MTKTILTTFGNRVRQERVKQGLSQEAFAEKAGVHRTYIGMIERAEKNITLINIEKIAVALNVNIAELFQTRITKEVSYIFHAHNKVEFNNGAETLRLEINVIRLALELTNQKIQLLSETAGDLFAVLGMRNLSAFMGELFVGAMVQATNGLVLKNPHQDGYPDLLAMTKTGQELWASLQNNLRDKKPFSPFATGGIEVKATCGSVPSPAQFQKKGLSKPDIGDARIDALKSYDWKAHHRQTANLIGLVWDFLQEVPTIVGLFHSASLAPSDWGEIIQPKEGGGRTTSVSIMTREGVWKMYQGWIAVIADERYRDFFNSFNKADLIA